MTKSLVFACLLSVCALSSFAQTPTNATGAKLVAERDAAYAKAHPAIVKVNAPKVRHPHKRHGHHHRHTVRKAIK